jgi:hypothetical protein
MLTREDLLLVGKFLFRGVMINSRLFPLLPFLRTRTRIILCLPKVTSQ